MNLTTFCKVWSRPFNKEDLIAFRKDVVKHIKADERPTTLLDWLSCFKAWKDVVKNDIKVTRI